MQSQDMTSKIDQFGDLIREVQYWSRLSDDDATVQGFEYCESMFLQSLEEARAMHSYLIEQLDNYLAECREQNIPIDLNYYRIQRELKSYSF